MRARCAGGVGVGLVLLTGVARAGDSGFWSTIGLGTRVAAPSGEVGVEGYMGFMGADAKGVAALDLQMALGGGTGGVTGQLGCFGTFGRVFGQRGARTRGLAVRGGFDLLVDSVGRVRASYVALPLAQVSYFDGEDDDFLDVGFNAAPILVGRLRYEQRARPLQFGLKAGPRLMLGRKKAFVRLDASYLLATTAKGDGKAGWGSALACIAVKPLNLCVAGSASAFEPPAATNAVGMGYVGLLLGFDIAHGTPFVPDVR